LGGPPVTCHYVADQQTHVVREIRRQPDAWRRAVALAAQLAPVLPQPGERVAVVGCGTSWFMAQAYAALREQRGLGETDAFAASAFPTQRGYERVVAISRSGTTSEVVGALAATSAQTVAITAVPGSIVTDTADDDIVLDFADEMSVVQTLFATTVLMLLRASLGESVDAVIDETVRVLASDGVPARDAAQVTFLGHGWAYGIAQEAALKMREAAQGWTEAYPQMEYRHGPIAIAEPGRAVWIFGQPVPGLAGEITATGATLVDDDLDPIADLVRAQLLAVHRAEAQGLDPDRPRRLTRSVVLGG
jgi:fructoselysine-6-P-deglycase FrlB-like protein